MEAEQRTGGVRLMALGGSLLALVVLVATRVASEPPQESSEYVAPVLLEEGASTDLGAEELGGLVFEEVSARAGLRDDADLRDPNPRINMTGGAVVSDFNGDGQPDVLLPRVGISDRLMINRGDGTFLDATEESGLGGVPTSEGSSTAAAADIDGDGDQDLYVAAAGRSAGKLWINDGSGRFEDRTEQSGVGGATAGDDASFVRGVTFDDYDGDGDMDLLILEWSSWHATVAGAAGGGASTCEVAERIREGDLSPPSWAGPSRSRLLNNDGAGRFVDVTAVSNLDLDRVAGFTGQFVDVDLDGDKDLLVAGDFCTSRIYLQVDGSFVDHTREAGVGTDENAMGSAVADIDSDGDPDWFLTSVSYPTADGSCPMPPGFGGCSGNRLWLNQGDGTYSDATEEYGLRHGWWGWGTAIEDFGPVGPPQVVQTNGFAFEPDPGSPDDTAATRAFFDSFAADPMRFWIRDENRYVDAAESVGIDGTGVGHALVPFDYDADGDLDVLVVNRPGGVRLYRNQSPASRGWVSVRLQDPGNPGNAHGVGARVRLLDSSEGSTRTAWVMTSGSYQAQRPPEVHFELGGGSTEAPQLDLEIWWPGMPATSQPQLVEDVAPNRVVTVTRQQ